MYVSGILPNVLYLALRPNVQFYGPSGVVYAFLGVVLGLSIFNLFPSEMSGLNRHAVKAYYQNLRNLALAMLSALVFVFVFGFLLLDPAVFFSTAPNANVFAHGLGFLVGFASAYAYRQLTHKSW